MGEENFKKTIQTLVHDKPEKLAFFDDLGESGAIPPFAPPRQKGTVLPVSSRQKETVPVSSRQKGTVPVSENRQTRRRRYSFAMTAAAACFAFCLCTAAVSYEPGMFDPASVAPQVVGHAPVIIDAPGDDSSGADTPGGSDGDGPVTGDGTAGDGPVTNDGTAGDGPGETTTIDIGQNLGSGEDGPVGGSGGPVVITHKPQNRTPFIIALICAAACAALFVFFHLGRKKLTR